MFKLLKNKKIFRAIAFMLVAVFTINVTGCSEPNNVSSGQYGGGNKNYSVAYRIILRGNYQIRGFGLPDYASRTS